MTLLMGALHAKSFAAKFGGHRHCGGGDVIF